MPRSRLIVASASVTSRAARGTAGASPQALSHDHRAAVACRHCCDEGVDAAQSGVAVAGALLLVAVHLNDRVVDVQEYVSVAVVPIAVVVLEQWGLGGEVGQEPGGERVELADVTEGERAQKRPQRRGRVAAGKDLGHPAVAKQGHVIDRVRAGEHPSHQRGDLVSRVGALVRRHGQPLRRQSGQARLLGQFHHGDQPRHRHEVRVVEGR